MVYTYHNQYTVIPQCTIVHKNYIWKIVIMINEFSWLIGLDSTRFFAPISPADKTGGNSIVDLLQRASVGTGDSMVPPPPPIGPPSLTNTQPPPSIKDLSKWYRNLLILVLVLWKLLVLFYINMMMIICMIVILLILIFVTMHLG